jgi:general secretion pathway protein A
MYAEFYGLRLAPFQLSPDPRFFYQSSVHGRALAYLKYGLSQHDGFIVITGEIGAGKTTLVQHLLSNLDSHQYLTANLLTTQLGAEELVRMVASKLGLPQTGLDKASLLRDLEATLISRFEVGQRCLLLVDEAQNLSVEALEELRMLSNLQFQSNPLIQSFLLGQPQLRRNLGRSDLGQLTQRIIASYHLGAMTELETAEYVLHRLRLADWKGDPLFEQSAFSEIHRYSGGIPRRINTVCARLLIYGFLEKKHTLDASSVHTVVEELNAELGQILETEGSAQPMRPVPSHPSSTRATPPPRDTNPATVSQYIAPTTVIGNLTTPIAAVVLNNPNSLPLPAAAVPTSTVSGLNHLEGMEVAILADGGVSDPQTVTGSEVALSEPGSQITIGLPFTPQLQTLPLDVPGEATVQDAREDTTAATIRVESSRGFSVGTNQPDQSTQSNFTMGGLKGAALATPNDSAHPLDEVFNTFETWLRHDHVLVAQLRSLVDDLKRESMVGAVRGR